MRIRHRVPTLFPFSMLAVFCCALGCVIFLWLYNEKLAKERSVKAGQSQQELSHSQSDLVSAQMLIDSLKKDLAASRQALAARLAVLEKTQADLTNAHALASSLRKELAESQQLAAAR